MFVSPIHSDISLINALLILIHGVEYADIIIVKEESDMVEKNLKKLQAKKRRVTNGFNTGTRDMKLKTAYRRNKRWSADDAGHRHQKSSIRFTPPF